MGKESSVAPKERVNIVYTPATGDAKEEVELPLKVLIMGDFTSAEDETPIEDRKAINIDKDNFNDVLDSYNISLDAVVDNKLSEEPDEQMAVKLNFNSLKDFDPDAIVDQVPEFKKKLNDLVKDDGAKERILKEVGVDE